MRRCFGSAQPYIRCGRLTLRMLRGVVWTRSRRPRTTCQSNLSSRKIRTDACFCVSCGGSTRKMLIGAASFGQGMMGPCWRRASLLWAPPKAGSRRLHSHRCGFSPGVMQSREDQQCKGRVAVIVLIHLPYLHSSKEEPPHNFHKRCVDGSLEHTWCRISVQEPSMCLFPSFFTTILDHVSVARNDSVEIPLRHSLNIAPHRGILYARNIPNK
ncbi:hypothetical protein BU23DRAFT_3135 [Bimuria novae-zelandiae CBS 107.79]|uniref:Uncharacterized protein n=1 Tax=Bimuria novae-zelandiae CBS 107.79 TaxID=1447943 RepID=A0A6A5VTB9_9PLEO|nr:hypothetical protein BU23DRAFT_3135 [Bimuria novae-zelandiae CBS 107.79]